MLVKWKSLLNYLQISYFIQFCIDTSILYYFSQKTQVSRHLWTIALVLGNIKIISRRPEAES